MVQCDFERFFLVELHVFIRVGDVNDISVGENTNIQDRVIVHCASVPEYPKKLRNNGATIIGKNVTIGKSHFPS